MKLSDLEYNLPKKFIAQYPPKIRGIAKLLVIKKKEKTIEHSYYYNLDQYLNPGDCVVLNNTKVIPARFFAMTKTEKIIEIFLLKNINPKEGLWEVLIGGAKNIKQGEKLKLETPIENGEMKDPIEVIIVQNEHDKPRLVKFPLNIDELAATCGHIPLPPYIRRHDSEEDRKRYQSVFAQNPGAVAAPTASLNFTEELIKKLKRKGIKIAYVTLHVGWDTFAPITEENVEKHEIHSEWFEITEENAGIINKTQKNGSKILSVGTTTTRVLETVSDENGLVQAFTGESEIYIYPGYKFKCPDMMLTNFHAPKTTVLLMTAAFLSDKSEFDGKEFLFKAYKEAQDKGYKFLSYGDSMLII